MERNIIHSILLDDYLQQAPEGLQQAFDALRDAEISTPNFSFYTSVASVYSSKIEGEDVELDSYIRHKRDGLPFQPDYTKKIDDLYSAYTFAQTHELNPEGVAAAHQLLTKHIVGKAWQGRFRTGQMYVTTDDGRIEYVAAPPQLVPLEMEKLYADLEWLLQADLSIGAVFYYAAMIHLVSVKIHPWNDGNGRSARLLEKWFLARKLGGNAWFLESEKYYYLHHQTYYSNIRKMGLEYGSLDYSKALPFLLMLPHALIK